MSTPKKKAAKSAKSAAASLQNPGTAVAVAGNTAMALPSGVKIVRSLQLPSLTIKPGESKVLVFMGKMSVSSVPPKQGEEPATVAHVVDPFTAENFMYLVPSVVESTLVDNYGPRGTRPEREDHQARQDIYNATEIVGKAFAIMNKGKAEGKRHHVYEAHEVTLPEQKPE